MRSWKEDREVGKKENFSNIIEINSLYFPFMWLDRKRPKLIDADHPPFFWWFVVELLDSFFLAAKSGSFDSFQVFVC
jgi:hypothetical protein